MPNIASSAQVAPSAVIADDVVIGPGCIIEDNVQIGSGTQLRANILVCKGTKIGKNNRIFHGVVLGEEPQDVSTVDPDTQLEIGDENVIREYATIHRGTVKGGGKTVVGNKNYLMVNSHLGHDCILGNNIVITNSCMLSGHVMVEDNAWLAGGAAVHQFATIGKFAYVAGYSAATQDIPPFLRFAGNSPCVPKAVNSIGLARNGFEPESIFEIKKTYREIFIRRKRESIVSVVDEVLAREGLDKNVRYMLEFMQKSFASPKRRFRQI